MGKVIHHNGDLFRVSPSKSILVHACNCQGVWGSGIAKQFADYYPDAYDVYRKFCLKDHPGAGSIKICPEERGKFVACLLTSSGFGANVDSEQEILEATERALNRLKIFVGKSSPVYSPRFNAGLFKVPWEKTEEIIQRVWPWDWNVVIPEET